MAVLRVVRRRAARGWVRPSLRPCAWRLSSCGRRPSCAMRSGGMAPGRAGSARAANHVGRRSRAARWPAARRRVRRGAAARPPCRRAPPGVRCRGSRPARTPVAREAAGAVADGGDLRGLGRIRRTGRHLCGGSPRSAGGRAGRRGWRARRGVEWASGEHGRNRDRTHRRVSGALMDACRGRSPTLTGGGVSRVPHRRRVSAPARHGSRWKCSRNLRPQGLPHLARSAAGATWRRLGRQPGKNGRELPPIGFCISVHRSVESSASHRPLRSATTTFPPGLTATAVGGCTRLAEA